MGAGEVGGRRAMENNRPSQSELPRSQRSTVCRPVQPAVAVTSLVLVWTSRSMKAAKAALIHLATYITLLIAHGDYQLKDIFMFVAPKSFLSPSQVYSIGFC